MALSGAAWMFNNSAEQDAMEYRAHTQSCLSGFQGACYIARMPRQVTL
jgi:hypothetical protein